MFNKNESVHPNDSQTLDSELRITSSFSLANEEYTTTPAGTFIPVLAAENDKVVASSAQLHDIVKDISPMHTDGCRTRRLHESSTRSCSTISQISIGAHVLPITHIQNIPRAPRTTQPTASEDIPLAILEHMAYDTAASTLSLRGVSSFSVTPLSLGLNSDRGILERSAYDNQVRVSFSPDRSNRMTAINLSVSPGIEVPLTAASPASSHGLFSQVSTSKGNDASLKTVLTTCLEHVASGSCADENDSQTLTKDDRDLPGKGLGSHFIESTSDRNPLLDSRNDGLNAESLEDIHKSSEKLCRHQKLSDTHLIRLLIPGLLETTKQRESLCKMLSPDQDHNDKGLSDKGEGCRDPYEVRSGKLANMPSSRFTKSTRVSNSDKLIKPASRGNCPTFHPSTLVPSCCRGWCPTYHHACSERNSVIAARVFNNPKQCARRVEGIWMTPEGTSTGVTSSSLVQYRDASAHMEPFQTWPFPALFKSLSSPFQSPSDESLVTNPGGDGLEGFTVDRGGYIMGKDDRDLSLDFLNHSPRIKLQPDYTCMNEQLGSFSPRLEATCKAWSRLPRKDNDFAVTNRCSGEETRDANLQWLLRPNSSIQRQGHDMGLLISGAKENVEFLRTWEMIYSAYMRNCSMPLGSSKVMNNCENYSSFDSSRVCQQCGFGSDSFHQNNFQSANSFDSQRHICSYSVPTPSTSVSGALSHSTGYYSFGNRLSLCHPNYQKMGFIPQYLGNFSHTETPSQGSRARAVKEKHYSNAKLQHNEKSHLIMDPVVIASIQRRPLLLATVFLRYTWAFLNKSIHDNGGTKVEDSGSSEALQSNAIDIDGLSCIPEDYTQAKQLPNVLPNNCNIDPAIEGHKNSSTDLSLTNPNGKMEKSIMESTLTLNTLTPNYSPLGHVCEDSNKKGVNFNSNAESRLFCREVVASSRDSNLEAFSSRQPSSRDSSQDVLCFTSSPFQERHRPSLTQFKKIVRHQHSIDNLEREVDNESNDLIVYVGTRLMGWLEVVALLGSGSFGQVFLCMDLRVSSGRFVHPSEIGGEDFAYWSCSHEYIPLGDCNIPPANSPFVAVKVVKSIPLFEQQSVLEAEMLVLIGVQTSTVDSREAAFPLPQTQNSALHPPPSDPRCAFIGKILAHGICYGHHCIVMERYGANLYEYIQSHEHSGLPMYQIRTIAKQLLSALTLLHENCHIIHADIKPENLLLTLDSCRGPCSNNSVQPISAKLRRSVSSVSVEDPNSGQATPESPKKCNNVESHCFSKKLLVSNVENLFSSLTIANLRAQSSSATVFSKRCLVGNCIDTSVRSEPLAGQSMKKRARAQSAKQTRTVPKTQCLKKLSCTLSQQQLTPDVVHKAVGSSVGSLLRLNPLETSMRGSTSLTIPRLHIKLIDFSSSCYDAGPFYTYIQSRYYRAPEVIVNAGYGPPIDLWSTGCVLAELLLGMPLLPGCNGHHQLSLIEDMLGPLPVSLLECGDSTYLYYDKRHIEDVNREEEFSQSGPFHNKSAATATYQTWKEKTGERVVNPIHRTTFSYKLLNKDDFLTKNNLPIVEYKRYFTCKTLQELVRQCPLPLAEKRVGHGLQPYVSAGESDDIPPDAKLSETMCNELMEQRFLLYDFLRQLLNPDPQMRPTAAQALLHPFLSSEFTYMQQFGLE